MIVPPYTALRASLHFAGDDVVPVGRLAAVRGRAYYEPDIRGTERGLWINPFFAKLPAAVPIEAKNPRAFHGLHGVFGDSLPDAWGETLMRRRAERDGLAFEALTPLDRLAWIGENGMGALTYRPDYSEAPLHEAQVDLDALADEAGALLDGSADMFRGNASDFVEQLQRLGGGSGGARPKVFVAMDEAGHVTTGAAPQAGYEPWLVKFRAPNDPIDAGAFEAAYADMARAAGLTVMPTRLLPGQRGGGFFATKRFDRVGSARVHVLSFAGLLDADWRQYGNGDYATALRVTLAVTRDPTAVEAFYRRMIFNVLAQNHDDHWKQHALLMDTGGRWTLAPSYDLTFSIGNEHYLTVNDKGVGITVSDLLTVARLAGVKSRGANAIFDEVATAVDDVGRFARAYGVRAKTIETAEKMLRRGIAHARGAG